MVGLQILAVDARRGENVPARGLMDHNLETEVAAGVSGGGFLAWRRKHALPPGSLCFNCATKLEGPWCHECGQLGEDYHRSAFHLIGETLEGLFHADGRLAKTLPRLLLRPAALTRDYLAGKRAPQVPPLRVFLVVLLIVFVVGGLTSHGNGNIIDIKSDHKQASDDPDLKNFHVSVGTPWDDQMSAWVRTHVAAAIAHPDQLTAGMAAWAHDFAFLALPISGFLLSMIFLFRRRFVLFDHLVFSMHSLSFQGLLFVTALTGKALVGDAAMNLLWLSPVHLFVHMRGVYGTGKIGTLIRMSVLFLLSSVSFAVLMALLVLVGLAELKS